LKTHPKNQHQTPILLKNCTKKEYASGLNKGIYLKRKTTRGKK
jgi:hypothetical protein